MNMMILIVLVLVIFIVLFGIGLSKQKRGEVLLIEIDNDVVNFYLSDDKYLTLDISKTKDNKEEIYNQIKKTVQNRAFELKNLVIKCSFLKMEIKKKKKSY